MIYAYTLPRVHVSYLSVLSLKSQILGLGHIYQRNPIPSPSDFPPATAYMYSYPADSAWLGTLAPVVIYVVSCVMSAASPDPDPPSRFSGTCRECQKHES